MTRILDRYVLREIVPPFLLALLVFTFMLMMQPIDRNAQALLELFDREGLTRRQGDVRVPRGRRT